MTTPTFLVVGAARCGTTGLVEGLRSHPRVFVTDPKEPHYFALHRIGASFTAPGDAHTINRVAVTDRDAYLALYPAEHSYVALGDASVSTMYYPQESIPEIKAMNPGMKLVMMLRDPVARAWSSLAANSCASILASKSPFFTASPNLAGTDSIALRPLYLVTFALVALAAAYRYWVSRVARPTFATSLRGEDRS